MKRLTVYLFAAVIASSFAMTPAFADEMMGEGMMGKRGMMMKEHQGMYQDAMGILKETMVILRDLNHTPSAEQKKKLDEMIMKMDNIMKRHQEMMKQQEERMMEKKEKKEGY